MIRYNIKNKKFNFFNNLNLARISNLEEQSYNQLVAEVLHYLHEIQSPSSKLKLADQ